MTDHKLPIFFRYRVLWHILFWVLVWLTYSVTYGGFRGCYFEELVINLTLLPVRIMAIYTMIYVLLPLLTDKKKYVLFALLALIHAFLFGQLVWATLYNLNFFPEYFDYSKYSEFNAGKVLSGLIGNYVIVVFAVVIVIFKKWYLSEQSKKKLTEEKLAAELSFLKSQVHPHFLFNTLNNLYALTLIKSDKTPDVVLKLSSLLDYMIYKSNDKFVALSKELEILGNYIELEKLRYNERLDLNHEIIGETAGYQIAPLILLPFIENSFKHGAGKDRANPRIDIKLTTDKEYLQLNVVNSVKGGGAKDETLAGGIGLANVRRRLELIYPGAHKLDIEQTDLEFKVNLVIYWRND